MSKDTRQFLLICDDGSVFKTKSDLGQPVADILGCARVGVVETLVCDFWHDDEFRYSGRPINVVASRLLAELVASQLDIQGDVLIAAVDAEGDTVGLSPEVLEDLGSRAHRIQAWAKAEGWIK